MEANTLARRRTSYQFLSLLISFTLLSFLNTNSASACNSTIIPSHSNQTTPSHNYTSNTNPSNSNSNQTNTTTSTSNAIIQSYKAFILTSCNSTTYPSICYQSLSPYASTIQAHPFNLCNVSLSLALKATAKASSLISELLGCNNETAKVAAVLRDCVDNVRDSVGELRQSLEEMAHLKDDVDRGFHVSTIQTAVSAAITDDETCSDGFDGVNVEAGVRDRIRESIVNVERMTSNALYFINNNLPTY